MSKQQFGPLKASYHTTSDVKFKRSQGRYIYSSRTEANSSGQQPCNLSPAECTTIDRCMRTLSSSCVIPSSTRQGVDPNRSYEFQTGKSQAIGMSSLHNISVRQMSRNAIPWMNRKCPLRRKLTLSKVSLIMMHEETKTAVKDEHTVRLGYTLSHRFEILLLRFLF